MPDSNLLFWGGKRTYPWLCPFKGQLFTLNSLTFSSDVMYKWQLYLKPLFARQAMSSLMYAIK